MPPSRRANRLRRQSCADPQTAAFATAANPQTPAQSEESAQVGRCSSYRGEESDGSDRDGSPSPSARRAAAAPNARRSSSASALA